MVCQHVFITYFSPCFPQAVRESVHASADDSVLKCLIDLADTCPKLLRTNLESILDLMLEVFLHSF